MADYTIEIDREFGFLRVSPPPPLPRSRSGSAAFDVPPSHILDHLEAATGHLAGKTVLDLGCRDGGFLAACRDRDMDGTGWEDVPDWASAATARGLTVLGDDLSTVLGGGTGRRHDVVSLFNLLPFVEDPSRVLHAVRQTLLADGGTLVVGVPNTFTPLQLAARAEIAAGEWWVDATAVRNCFTSQSLTDLLEGCAFAVDDLFGDLPREVFLLGGAAADAPLEDALARKRRFSEASRRHDAGPALRQLEAALGRLGLGENLVAIARPDAFSKPCRATVLKKMGE